jgi:hypothetical protein
MVDPVTKFNLDKVSLLHSLNRYTIFGLSYIIHTFRFDQYGMIQICRNMNISRGLEEIEYFLETSQSSSSFALEVFEMRWSKPGHFLKLV